LAAGRLSAVQALDETLERIRRLNPPLNAVISLNEKSARARAEKLDRARAETGKPSGPLHGVPFTIKDAFRIEGFRSSYGWPGFRLIKASDSCTVARRLLDAGGVPVGLTNVPFACFDWQCDSPVYGTSVNPYDLNRTCGGSSGGSAAALAAGLTPFEVGSDLGGSIRYPAHCCGVFGLRPTHGLVPFHDVGPAFHAESFRHFAVAGPMARSLADLELVFSVIGEYRPLPGGSGKLRLKFAREWLGIGMESEARALFDKFVSDLRAAGHSVEDGGPDIDMAEALRLWGMVVGGDFKRMTPKPFQIGPFAHVINQFLNRRKLKRGIIPDGIERGLLGDLRKGEAALRRVAELAGQFDKFMAGIDAWLTPCSPGPAIIRRPTGAKLEIDGHVIEYSDYLGNFLCPPVVFGHPILSAPVGLDSRGLPMNIQIHGRRGGDAELLRTARLVNALLRQPDLDRADAPGTA
jgi:amidase